MSARRVPGFPSRGWRNVLLNSRLSTKRKDALGNEKRVAGSGWQFLPPVIKFTKLSSFNRKYLFSYREYMVPGKVSIISSIRLTGLR